RSCGEISGRAGLPCPVHHQLREFVRSCGQFNPSVDEEIHADAPAFARIAALRGRTMRNSVYCPGSVSTSMDPPCCLTMMSWLMDKPSPVPSPAGLVVKNGLNIFSLNSVGIPVPLSTFLTSSISP